jgi:proton-dependent oligopeptide transporter, POT family
MLEPEVNKSPLREIIEPFINIGRAPRALWGVNLTYFLEGMCYFGILTLLTLYYHMNVGLDDVHAGLIVGVFTGGITLAMFFFGELADRWGVRSALVLALVLMVVGRVFLTGAGSFGGAGLWSPVFLSSMFGLLLVVFGYGIYQPAAYLAVRIFTTKETATMGYAMLYALMNLGGFVSGIVSPPIRGAYGITGIYWFYTGCTVLGVFLVIILMTKKHVLQAQATAAGGELKEKAGKEAVKDAAITPETPGLFRRLFAWWKAHPWRWIKAHPLGDIRFSFFIFVLIPVQTLFAHQWLTMPSYVLRAYPAWVSNNMETFVNINPLLIFVLTPMVAAFTSKVNVYKMMIIGTMVMALPTFFLALGPSVPLLATYILFSSLGEAMWQPRFLQFAAELAPEGKTGQYMGIAQFPWFLTKVLTSFFSGYMLSKYCPDHGPQNTETMWAFYGLIAIISPIALILAKKWIGGKLSESRA